MLFRSEIRCDNTSAINISKNPVHHSRTKHIDIRHHFLCDHAGHVDEQQLPNRQLTSILIMLTE